MDAVKIVESILQPLGTSLRHYTPSVREKAIEAAQKVKEEIISSIKKKEK